MGYYGGRGLTAVMVLFEFTNHKDVVVFCVCLYRRLLLRGNCLRAVELILVLKAVFVVHLKHGISFSGSIHA